MLSDFIKSYSWSSVLLLASVNISMAEEDESVLFSPWRSILPPSSDNAPNGVVDRLREVPALDQTPSVDPLRESSSSVAAPASRYPPWLPDGGLCPDILEKLQSTSTPPHGALAGWCAEGDNRGDAFGMAGVVTFLLGIEREVQLREPRTWAGLFGGHGTAGGTGADSDLYG